MNKMEMIAAMAEKMGSTKKDAEVAISAFTEVITETVASGDKVSIVGFGSFESKLREARSGRNPQTGETMTFPECHTPKFKAGKAFKDALNA